MKDWPWYYFIIIAVLILGFFYLLYYKPKSSELHALKDNREQIEREFIQLRAKKKQLDKIEAQVQQMDITLKDLETIIPSKKEISDILTRTEQLAYDSNLDIKKYTPKGEILKEFYSDWPIEIEVQGNYHNLARFFARLSNFSRLFTVENFTIKNLQSQTANTTISAKFITQTYILREASAEPKPKSRRRQP
jgi:type IV pilus assembly protein PilO